MLASCMPVVAEFFGINIYLRFLDHNPPHFHAKYGNQEVGEIGTLEVD